MLEYQHRTWNGDIVYYNSHNCLRVEHGPRRFPSHVESRICFFLVFFSWVFRFRNIWQIVSRPLGLSSDIVKRAFSNFQGDHMFLLQLFSLGKYVGTSSIMDLEDMTQTLGGGFKDCLFSPLPGEMIQFDEHIFQMGWNHQLELVSNWKFQGFSWNGHWS